MSDCVRVATFEADNRRLEISPHHQYYVRRSRVGFANSGGLVFVDESAEEVATA
jgi:hypothetical protein